MVATRFVAVALLETTFARFAVPVAVILVPVALSNNKFEIYPVTTDKKLVKKLPEFTIF